MGRIFENLREAYNEIERDISEMGITVKPKSMQNKIIEGNDDFTTLEIQNYNFTILSLKDKDSLLSEECLNWCREEFKERISNDSSVNPGKAYLLRENVWKEFLNEDGYFDYTYHDRIKCQIDYIIEELKKNQDSRQCVIDIHDWSDCHWLGGQKRLPCSLNYIFMIRRGKLDIIYNMRSSDYDTHFLNDCYLADELRNYIAKKVGVGIGLFSMNIGSLHRYKNYIKKHVF